MAPFILITTSDFLISYTISLISNCITFPNIKKTPKERGLTNNILLNYKFLIIASFTSARVDVPPKSPVLIPEASVFSMEFRIRVPAS